MPGCVQRRVRRSALGRRFQLKPVDLVSRGCQPGITPLQNRRWKLNIYTQVAPSF